MSGEGPVLEVEDLMVRRDGRAVLAGLSLAVAPGRAVAVAGPNGCGKSTLLAAIAGVLPPTAGRVTIGGHAVWGGHRARAAARRALGFVPEAADPPGFLRGGELWALVAASRGAPPPDDGLRAALGLDELAPLRLERMSLGQRRRACLGAALLGGPALLVLDEPDNGLDPARLDALTALLRARLAAGGAILVASHDEAWLDRLGAERWAFPTGPAR